MSKLRMPDLNKVILAGRLGRDADTIETQERDGYRFSVCASRRVKRGDEWADDTTWIDCVYWPRSDNDAARVDNFLRKGRAVIVEGSIRVREYDAKDGTRRKAFQVLAYSLQPLDWCEDEQQERQPAVVPPDLMPDADEDEGNDGEELPF